MSDRAIFELSDDFISTLTEPATLDAVPEAVVVADERGEVIGFNAGAAEVFGYSRDEAMGRTVAELIIPPNLREAHWLAFEQFKEGGEPRLIGRRVEFEAMRADGSPLMIELSLVQLRRNPLTVAGYMRDITERVRAESSHSEMTALLGHAERIANLGSWSWDPATDEVVWSTEMFRLHGYEPGSVRPSLELALRHMSPEGRAENEEVMAAYRNNRPAGNPMERTMVRADGEERIVVTRSQEAGAPGGKVIGIMQDVTEVRRAQHELEGYLTAAERLRDWSVEDGMTGLLAILGKPLDWTFGAIWLPDADRGELYCAATWSAEGHDFAAFEAATRKLRFPRGRGLVGRAWEARDPVGSDDLSAEESFVRAEAAAESGLASGIAFPGLREGVLIGILELYGTHTRRVSAEMARMLHLAGYPLAHCLDRHDQGRNDRLLSDRERQILMLAADGGSTPRIAEELVLSPETVKTHFERIYAKLGVRDRAAAVAQGFRRGLIT